METDSTRLVWFPKFDVRQRFGTRAWGGRFVAVREGFEPSIRFPVYTRSRRAPSTTRPPHHRRIPPILRDPSRPGRADGIVGRSGGSARARLAARVRSARDMTECPVLQVLISKPVRLAPARVSCAVPADRVVTPWPMPVGRASICIGCPAEAGLRPDARHPDAGHRVRRRTGRAPARHPTRYAPQG